MYHEKMAVAIKTKGKVLREFNRDTVYIPFGEEYSILIKNLNTVKALVNISIDGTDVADNNSFVVEGNSELEVTRFVKNGNLKKGNRFKFIERTAGVEQARGVQVEDGLIRVEFSYEKVIPKPDTVWINQWNVYRDKCPSPQFPSYPPFSPFTYTTCSSGESGLLRGLSGSSFNAVANGAVGGSADVAQYSAEVKCANVNSFTMSANAAVPQNDAGITVAGSVSDQKFHEASSFVTESASHAIVFKLFGFSEGGKQVSQPITVKSKQKCTTCTKVNKATAKFCVECGTSLEIV